MPRPLDNTATLPKSILNKLGIKDATSNHGKRLGPSERKDRRKAARVQKRTPTSRIKPRIIARKQQFAPILQDDDASNTPEDPSIRNPQTAPAVNPQVPKSILKARKQKDSDKVGKESLDGRDRLNTKPRLPTAIANKLAADDAEIAALENALGIKGKAKLPKESDQDGLDDLLGGLDDHTEQNSISGAKRKRSEEEEWLENKRRKARGLQASAYEKSTSDDEQSQLDESVVTSKDDRSDNEDFDGFESDIEIPNPVPARSRENPYIAPVTASSTGHVKYVPPPQRAADGSEEEAMHRLRRQIQGLLNRLSEANMLSMLGDVEKFYANNPRQHVSTTLVNLLMGLLCDPTSLQDTFIILHAGFIAAIYKVVGTDFGAQVVQRIVEDFDKIYNVPSRNDFSGKKLANIVSLLAELYNFQVVGNGLIYDLIRLFLEDLSEANTELLLKIIRNSGPQLRQDDPSSLKEIVLLLQPAVAKIGADNLSVRTKFMIETINYLKNNRMKTGLAASAITSEHSIRMKKALGSLNTRSIKAGEPLRVHLKDIRDSDKRGKWWLVGASYRDEDRGSSWKSIPTFGNGNSDQYKTAEAIDGGSADLLQLANEHRMNTDIRRSIFVTVMSAMDYRDAHLRLMKLRLKKSQELEIPRVLLHCAAAEKTYNPFYTLISRLLCMDRKLKMAFQFSLWDLFKRMGEDTNDEDEAIDDDLNIRAIVNLSRLYGVLIAEGGLGLSVLKVLNLTYLKPKTHTFVELLLITVLIHSGKSTGNTDEQPIMDMFLKLKDVPEMVRGLQHFLRKFIRKTDIAGSEQDKETVRWGCMVANDTLVALSTRGVITD